MSGITNGRLTAGALARTAPCQYHVPKLMAVLAVLLVALAEPAQAQFGGLKKLKKAMSQPDTAAQVATDSTAEPGAAQATDVGKPKGSFLRKALSAASSASNKMETVTGISAKDAALAATGVGAAGLVAKKMGVPSPTSMGGNMLKKAAGNALQQKMGGTSGGISGALSGAISGGVAAKLGAPVAPSASAAAMGNAALGSAMGNAMGAMGNMALGKGMKGKMLSSAGIGAQADAAAMLAFQQDMMQTAAAASAGDRAAQARLDAWQAIALKYQAEAQKLSTAAAAGDMSSVLRLQQLQVDMMKEWVGTGSLRSKLGKP